MSGNPWTRFFWSDWSADEQLRACSLAAQGLWMRMLCVAAQHHPIGYVAINGRKLESADLAKLGQVELTQAESLLQELEANGVFSRARNGMIYNRRMVRDDKKSKVNAKNGHLGAMTSGWQERRKYASPEPPPEPRPEPQSQKPVSNKEVRELIKSAVPRAARASPTDTPEGRKQRWEQIMMGLIIEKFGPDRGWQIIEAYQAGDMAAKKIFNDLDHARKAGS